MSGTNENKQLMDVLTNVRIDIARLEGKMDVIKDLQHEVDSIKEKANEALQSVRSAHHRLNEHEQDWRNFYKEVNSRFAAIHKIFFWAATTIIGGIILGALGLLFNQNS